MSSCVIRTNALRICTILPFSLKSEHTFGSVRNDRTKIERKMYVYCNLALNLPSIKSYTLLSRRSTVYCTCILLAHTVC